MTRKKNDIDREFITSYTIAAICIITALVGYFYKDMDTLTVRWLIGFAVILSEGRDISQFIGVNKYE